MVKLRVLAGCEYSGKVRRAFEEKGHDVISCDLEPAEDGAKNHYQGDIFDIIDDGFDLMIAHPPCTFMTLAGARWFYDPNNAALPHPKYPNRWDDRDKAIEFFLKLKRSKIKKICLESIQPLGYVTDRVGDYTQKVQPWMFGEPYTKGACLWLKDLPKLVATHSKPEKIIAACHMASPGPNRWKERSRTYQSIANAMAEQWGS